MIHKRPHINININANAEETSAEELKKLYAVLMPQKEKLSNQKHIDLYLLSSDIEELNERYDQLFKKVKTSPNLSEKQIEKECDVLSQKYDFEIEELSKMRKLEYDELQAQIAAKSKEQTPWRRSWLWRLILRPTTNRAQRIIEKQAALEADARFTAIEKALEARANKLNVENAATQKKADIGCLMTVAEAAEIENKFRALERQVQVTIEQDRNADCAAVQTEPPEPPTRKPRNTT